MHYVPVSDSRDTDANIWVRTERFVTPVSANASQPIRDNTLKPKSLPQPKRTACANQAELSEKQMTKLREIRAFLGVEDSKVVGRK